MKWKVYGLAVVAGLLAPLMVAFCLARKYSLFCVNVAEEVLEDVKDSERPNRT
jgi:hypothetical protein